MLDLDAISAAPVATEPFPYFIAQGVLGEAALRAVNADFPAIAKPGIFPLSELRYGESFASLVAEIESAELEALIGDKFGIALAERPLMVTVRGFCRGRDGRIHNDSKDKLITCLLYLNPQGWSEPGGRLRLLRDGVNLENSIAEVPPDGGNFVAFRRTDNSWHGHAPFEGPRRYIMFNWLTTDGAYIKNIGRHKFSAAFKRLESLGRE